jgi:hypothetical protein
MRAAICLGMNYVAVVVVWCYSWEVKINNRSRQMLSRCPAFSAI